MVRLLPTVAALTSAISLVSAAPPTHPISPRKRTASPSRQNPHISKLASSNPQNILQRRFEWDPTGLCGGWEKVRCYLGICNKMCDRAAIPFGAYPDAYPVGCSGPKLGLSCDAQRINAAIEEHRAEVAQDAKDDALDDNEDDENTPDDDENTPDDDDKPIFEDDDEDDEDEAEPDEDDANPENDDEKPTKDDSRPAEDDAEPEKSNTDHSLATHLDRLPARLPDRLPGNGHCELEQYDDIVRDTPDTIPELAACTKYFPDTLSR